MSSRIRSLVLGIRRGGKTPTNGLDHDGQEVKRDESDEINFGADGRIAGTVAQSVPELNKLREDVVDAGGREARRCRKVSWLIYKRQ